eukprot:TRINITY_DN1634_c0_g3_i1.p1 TRINITY_DN1634_c0_g3~~TRINITY_DN1634_c0_g3_i1.p1  ORF type:complete len:700 (-),score=159.44 TRINITY_DN1634_c0_g3_i1:7-2106(-)
MDDYDVTDAAPLAVYGAEDMQVKLQLELRKLKVPKRPVFKQLQRYPSSTPKETDAPSADRAREFVPRPRVARPARSTAPKVVDDAKSSRQYIQASHDALMALRSSERRGKGGKEILGRGKQLELERSDSASSHVENTFSRLEDAQNEDWTSEDSYTIVINTDHYVAPVSFVYNFVKPQSSYFFKRAAAFVVSNDEEANEAYRKAERIHKRTAEKEQIRTARRVFDTAIMEGEPDVPTPGNSGQSEGLPRDAKRNEIEFNLDATTNDGNQYFNAEELCTESDQFAPENLVFTGKSVFFDEGDSVVDGEMEFRIDEDGNSVFFDDSAVDDGETNGGAMFFDESSTRAVQELQFDLPSRQDLEFKVPKTANTNFFIEAVPTSGSRSAAGGAVQIKRQGKAGNPLEPEEEEIANLANLVAEGFLDLKEFQIRQKQLLAGMNERLALTRQRNQALRAEQIEQSRKLMEIQRKYQAEKKAEKLRDEARDKQKNIEGAGKKKQQGKKVASTKPSSGDPVLDKIRGFVQNDAVADHIYRYMNEHPFQPEGGGGPVSSPYTQLHNRAAEAYKQQQQQKALADKTQTGKGKKQQSKPQQQRQQQQRQQQQLPDPDDKTYDAALRSASDVLYILHISGRDPKKALSTTTGLDITHVHPTPEVMHTVERVANGQHPSMVKGLVRHVKIERRLRTRQSRAAQNGASKYATAG